MACVVSAACQSLWSASRAKREAPCPLRPVGTRGAAFTPSAHRIKCRGRRVAVFAAADTQQAVRPTEWVQKVVELPPLGRGCHVVTRKVLAQVPELAEFEVGLANIFTQHTSCSLTINENASPDVPLDLADSLDRLAPEGNKQVYRHDDEGDDDMPAHVKSSLMGVSMTIPIQHGRLALGTWQGIYLNEHRNYGGPRRLVITLQGVKRADGRKYSGYS